MSQVLYLESFDGSASVTTAKHPEFLRGFAEGRKDAENSAHAQALEKMHQLTDILDAAQFTYAEARIEAINDLKTVINVALSELLPAVASIGLAEKLKELVEEALMQEPSGIVTVTVPQSFSSLCGQLGDEIPLRIQDDAEEGTVSIKVDQQETLYSLERPLAATKTALDYLTLEPTRIAEDG